MRFSQNGLFFISAKSTTQQFNQLISVLLVQRRHGKTAHIREARAAECYRTLS